MKLEIDWSIKEPEKLDLDKFRRGKPALYCPACLSLVDARIEQRNKEMLEVGHFIKEDVIWT